MILLAAALVAEVADLVTFLKMGIAYELNPIVHHAGVPASVTSKVLLIGVLVLFSVAARMGHPKVKQALLMVTVVSIVLGSIGAYSNLSVILA
jgi:hypothetical protein